ncbi:MAG: hypothetical protein U1D55_09775 [Phycisphaerae bacterium]
MTRRLARAFAIIWTIMPAALAIAQAPDPPLAQLVEQLGVDEYAQREAATRAILARGASITTELERARTETTDPESRRRLNYILDNIVPPQRAVLVLCADDETQLRCGDLITHVNGRRVASVDELRTRMTESRAGYTLRATRGDGPRDVGPVSINQLDELCDYAAPRGETLARAARLYADGLAEQALDALRTIKEPIDPAEFSPLLHARIAYTAGDAETAHALVGGHNDFARSSAGRDEWSGPSLLDLSGPGRAPFHLQWELLSDSDGNAVPGASDPDLRVQRVLVPAGRYADALDAAARLWWNNYRAALTALDSVQAQEVSRVAGNMLAVTAWMFHELDLTSECARLIEPRSTILESAWMRVQTDAWLAFLSGKEQDALDRFYDEARPLLQRPNATADPRRLTRNPQVAAIMAFFLYQLPHDPRVEDMLAVVNEPGHIALSTYAHWMLTGLNPTNEDVVRRHLLLILPNLSDAEAAPFARAAALLEYAQATPDADVFVAARERLSRQSAGTERDDSLALIDALALLSAGRYVEARDLLNAQPPGARPEILLRTAEFLANPPESAAGIASLGARSPPLVVVPFGAGTEEWIALTRDRRLLRFDAANGGLAVLAKPSASWMPLPDCWPWLGREPASGRVWVYDRRRIVELGAQTPLSFNIRAEDIAAFDRLCSAAFSRIAARAKRAPGDAEDGEFLRREIVAHAEYVGDPDLPEIGTIAPIANLPGLVHVAIRGGAQFLIDAKCGIVRDSEYFAEKLGLERPPAFFPMGIGEPGAADVVWLLSDQGLIRFGRDRGECERIALPGDAAYPALIPESAPFERRDARWLYFARLPGEGGQVYRMSIADRRVEPLNIVNDALPPDYYRTMSRSQLRAMLDARFVADGRPAIQPFITDVNEVVARWKTAKQR